METIKKYSRASMALIIIMSAIAGFSVTTTQASAQSLSASFDPQTQFPVGSSLTIKSVYGIATASPMRNQTRDNQPPNNQTRGNQTGEQSIRMYSASITVNVQVASDTQSGGVQLNVQAGVIMINEITFTITEGKGEMNNIDRLTMEGTATGANGQTFKWRMEGLAALYNGTVITNLNSNATTSIDSDGATVDLSMTCIATMS